MVAYVVITITVKFLAPICHRAEYNHAIKEEGCNFVDRKSFCSIEGTKCSARVWRNKKLIVVNVSFHNSHRGTI